MISEKIERERRKKGWSQEELADKLNLPCQSIYEWESGQSVPEVEDAVRLSRLFGVSMDYLLKDEIALETTRQRATEKKDAPQIQKERIQLETVNEFLRRNEKITRLFAIGVFLCIVSPIAIIILAGMNDLGLIAENFASSIGLFILVILVAIAVALFIYGGLNMKRPTGRLSAAAEKALREEKNAFHSVFTRRIITGTVLCVLSVIPILVGSFLYNDFILICASAALLFIIAVATLFFVTGAMRLSAIDHLLEL